MSSSAERESSEGEQIIQYKLLHVRVQFVQQMYNMDEVVLSMWCLKMCVIVMRFSLTIWMWPKCPHTKAHAMSYFLCDIVLIVSSPSLSLSLSFSLRLGYASASDVIEVKGRVACEISTGDELLLTELIFSGAFNNLSVEQATALLSCFVFQEKVESLFLFLSLSLSLSFFLSPSPSLSLSLSLSSWRITASCTFSGIKHTYRLQVHPLPHNH